MTEVPYYAIKDIPTRRAIQALINEIAGLRKLVAASGGRVVVQEGGGGGGEGYVLPVAGPNRLGGVKVGANLSITAGGVLNAAGATPYVLPVASADTLGGVKVGSGLAIADGVLSATGGGGGGSTVSIELPTGVTGLEIAKLTIDGTEYSIIVPTSGGGGEVSPPGPIVYGTGMLAYQANVDYVGDVIIDSLGLAKGFDTAPSGLGSYFLLPETTINMADFEIQVRAKYTGTTNKSHRIICNSIVGQSSSGQIMMYADTSSASVANFNVRIAASTGLGGTPFSNIAPTWYRFSQHNNVFTAARSDDGETWVQITSSSRSVSSSLQTVRFVLGVQILSRAYTSISSAFAGWIDLKECYIKSEGTEVWRGATITSESNMTSNHIRKIAVASGETQTLNFLPINRREHIPFFLDYTPADATSVLNFQVEGEPLTVNDKTTMNIQYGVENRIRCDFIRDTETGYHLDRWMDS